MNEDRTRGPWKKAFREARGVVLAGLFVALAFNLFASTGVPWLRELPSVEQASDSLLFGDASASANALDSTAPATASAVDTAAQSSGPATETDTAAAAAAEEKQRVADSIRAARKAVADSIKEAQAQAAKALDVRPEKGTFKEINSQQAKLLFDKKRGFWIDARPATIFAESHIPGAINIYPEELRNHLNDLPIQNMDGLVVVYCNGGLCELSHELAEQLVGLGFTRVVVYAGGFDEWTANNYPVTNAK
jgi:rhodanese-related sulfurtransferase